MWNLKYDTHTQINKIWHKWTYLWNRLTDIENKLVVAKWEEGWGKGGVGVWDEQMQIIIYRMDKQQGPTI